MANPVPNPFQPVSPGRVLWIDYLRSFITFLVVAHHSTLAYTEFARANPRVYMLSTHPVIDSKRWIGLDIFENFNDVFFMALMFLIGGIFVVKGLQKKGIIPFIRDRFYRLFLPFVIAVSSLMLIAYYPAFLNAHPEGGIKDFLSDFFFVEGWPPGPPWFIWVLFLFNSLLAIFGKSLIPLIIKAGNKIHSWKNNPFRVVLLFYATVWLLYVPASWLFGAYTWKSFGPFAFQESRPLLYFGFFIFGTMIGGSNIGQGLFSSDSGFMKKWPSWLAGCVLFYLMLLVLKELGREGFGKTLGEWPFKIIYGSVYAGSICFSCLAFMSIFRKYATRSTLLWDSLSENAYCIYLVHYIFVLWCQYAMLYLEIPALIKFLITFILSLFLSWMISILLRKITVVKTYV
jgi:glucans biosynthesis protein C